MISSIIVPLGPKRVKGGIISEAMFALETLLIKTFPEMIWKSYDDDMYHREDTFLGADYELIPRMGEFELRRRFALTSTPKDPANPSKFMVSLQSVNDKRYYHEIEMVIGIPNKNCEWECFEQITSEHSLWPEASRICAIISGQLLSAIKIVQA